MSNEIELRGDAFDLGVIEPLANMAEKFSRTNFVPASYRGKPEEILACMLTGQEIAIGPLHALRAIHVIDGRPSLSSELMRGLVQRAGHRLWFDDEAFTTTRVRGYGERSDGVQRITVEWTMDMAKAARLDQKENWKKHPRQMLAARVTSEICRLLFADVIAGMSYTAEELGDGDVIDGEVVEEEPKKQTSTKRRSSTPARSPYADKPAQASKPQGVATSQPANEGVVTAQPQQPARPPLPGQAKQAAAPAQEEQTAEEKSRSQEVVKLAKALKVDHHPVVKAVTQSQKESARRLSAQEASEVMDLLRAVSEERAKIVVLADGLIGVEWVGNGGVDEDDGIIDAEVVDEDDNGRPFGETNEAENEAPAGQSEAESYGVEEWRELLNSNGKRVPHLLRKAAEVWGDREGQAPGTLGDIAGKGVADELLAWVKGES